MQFSLHRVWLLCRKQWTENQQLYLLGTLALAGIMAAVIIYNLTVNRGLDRETQQIIFFIGAIPAGTIFASTILSQFSDKVKGIQALTLPASTFEKLLTALIYSLVIFPLVYTLLVYPLLAIGHYIDIRFIGRVNISFNRGSFNEAYLFAIIFAMLQTAALLGSVLFKRFVYIKSVILVIVILFSIQAINPFIKDRMFKMDENKAVKASVEETYFGDDQKLIGKTNSVLTIYPRSIYASPYNDIRFTSEQGAHKSFMGHNYTNITVSIHNRYNVVFTILFYLTCPFLWIITWLKLKEKQL